MKRAAKIFLLVGTLSFAALFISSPLLHNHKIDFHTHTNCPAFILNIVFASFAFTFLVNLVISFPQSIDQIILKKYIYVTNHITQFQSDRAPPFK